ncbi:MAG: TetR/AcrR family transcriptional regulator [Deltaproteobacteria bacterium]|nr:TetR/AcrR family transcriptional regulator [Deltaproteobacteria bacterium]
MPRIPASERDAFYEARRTALAEVALKLWAERGFDRTPVAAIAREAGIAKGTFYLYFESKGALLLEVLRRNSLVPDVLALIRALETEPMEDAVHAFVRGAWRHLAGHRELLLVAMRELPTHLEQAREAVERVLVPTNAALARHLESRLGARLAGRLSPVIAVRALVGMIVVVFLSQEVLGAGRFLPVPEEEITRTIAELFLRGVTSPEGPPP